MSITQGWYNRGSKWVQPRAWSSSGEQGCHCCQVTTTANTMRRMRRIKLYQNNYIPNPARTYPFHKIQSNHPLLALQCNNHQIEPYWFTHPGTTWASLLQAMWSSQSTARPELTISSANSPGLIQRCKFSPKKLAPTTSNFYNTQFLVRARPARHKNDRFWISLTHYPIITPLRGSHGLRARRAWRTLSSRPEGPQPRSWAPRGAPRLLVKKILKQEARASTGNVQIFVAGIPFTPADHHPNPSSFQMEISDNNLSREILCCSTDGKISSQLEGSAQFHRALRSLLRPRSRSTPSYNTNC